jgi:uncharacterized membrane protein YozB (DUF420 family)
MSYRHAHWYLLAALAAIVAGFWSSFFRPLTGGSTWHTLHGLTATGWVVALILQSWLIARGHRAWHRRVAWCALALLPVMIGSALYMVQVMQGNPQMPPFLPPLLAFIDIPSIAFLILLVTLALLNVRRPAAHRRYMVATVFLAFPPALTRLYARVLTPWVDFPMALHGSFLTVELILTALIIGDRRAGQRHLAYPISLVFFIAVHALMMPVSSTDGWRSFMTWFASLL